MGYLAQLLGIQNMITTQAFVFLKNKETKSLDSGRWKWANLGEDGVVCVGGWLWKCVPPAQITCSFAISMPYK